MWMPHVLLIYCPTQIHKTVIITPGLPWWISRKDSACNAGDLGLIPGLGQSPGEGNGNPLQNSCLENSMDRGAWWTTVHGVAKMLNITWWPNNHHLFLFLSRLHIKMLKITDPRTMSFFKFKLASDGIITQHFFFPVSILSTSAKFSTGSPEARCTQTAVWGSATYTECSPSDSFEDSHSSTDHYLQLHPT